MGLSFLSGRFKHVLLPSAHEHDDDDADKAGGSRSLQTAKRVSTRGEWPEKEVEVVDDESEEFSLQDGAPVSFQHPPEAWSEEPMEREAGESDPVTVTAPHSDSDADAASASPAAAEASTSPIAPAVLSAAEVSSDSAAAGTGLAGAGETASSGGSTVARQFVDLLTRAMRLQGESILHYANHLLLNERSSAKLSADLPRTLEDFVSRVRAELQGCQDRLQSVQGALAQHADAAKGDAPPPSLDSLLAAVLTSLDPASKAVSVPAEPAQPLQPLPPPQAPQPTTAVVPPPKQLHAAAVTAPLSSAAAPAPTVVAKDGAGVSPSAPSALTLMTSSASSAVSSAPATPMASSLAALQRGRLQTCERHRRSKKRCPRDCADKRAEELSLDAITINKEPTDRADAHSGWPREPRPHNRTPWLPGAVQALDPPQQPRTHHPSAQPLRLSATPAASIRSAGGEGHEPISVAPLVPSSPRDGAQAVWQQSTAPMHVAPQSVAVPQFTRVIPSIAVSSRPAPAPPTPTLYSAQPVMYPVAAPLSAPPPPPAVTVFSSPQPQAQPLGLSAAPLYVQQSPQRPTALRQAPALPGGVGMWNGSAGTPWQPVAFATQPLPVQPQQLWLYGPGHNTQPTAVRWVDGGVAYSEGMRDTGRGIAVERNGHVTALTPHR